ncbi:MAG: CBS domain-containing protein [Actinomycetota bacterium]|nr:CBS domain-containing protein [Actinomycetota bacterium]
MVQTVRDVMTANPVTIDASQPVLEAARLMRAADTGVLVVTADGAVHGVVTDRDITVRAVADGRDVATTPVSDVASTDVESVGPDASLTQVVQTMRSRAVRRVPVVEGGRVVGIVSIGDLALEVDPSSALADVSAAPSDQ